MPELRFVARDALDNEALGFVEALGARVFARYSRSSGAVVAQMIRADGARVEVAFSERGRPLGFVVVTVAALGRRFGPWESPAAAHLDAIAVVPELEGRGIGRALLAHGESVARDAGAVGMSLMTARANRRARELFVDTGYRAFLDVERAYAGGQPGILMLKLLDVPVVC